MVLGRNPVRSTKESSCFSGLRTGGTTNGTEAQPPHETSMEHYTTSNSEAQPKNRDNTPLVFGVRTKHDPKNLLKPKFDGHKRRWHSLEETKRRLIARDKNRAYFPNMAPLLYHEAERHDDGSIKKKGRKRPTQRIESMLNLLTPWFLETFNLSRRECGYYVKPDTTYTFIHFNYEYYSQKTGLTINRIKRCMKVLVGLGICTVSSIYEEDEYGNVKTIKVIIKLTDKIFQMMGTELLYLKDLERATKHYKRMEDTATGIVARLLALTAKVQPPQHPPHEAPSRKNGNNNSGDIIPQVRSILPGLPYENTTALAYKHSSRSAFTRGGVPRSTPAPKVVEVHTATAKPSAALTNPYQDQSILAEAADLIAKAKLNAGDGRDPPPSFKEAVRRVCIRRGIDPPAH